MTNRDKRREVVGYWVYSRWTEAERAAWSAELEIPHWVKYGLELRVIQTDEGAFGTGMFYPHLESDPAAHATHMAKVTEFMNAYLFGPKPMSSKYKAEVDRLMQMQVA